VKRIPLVTAIVASLLCLGIAALWSFAVAREYFAGTVGWDQPLSREQAIARSVIDYSFPPSARDIYECMRSVGTQENPSFVRLTVDPAEVESHIRDIEQRRFFGLRNEPSQQTAVTDPRLHRPSRFPPPPSWWRVSDIEHGYAVYFGDAWLTFWYDSDRQILYCYDVG
jgi:hypothetical protein